MSINLMKNIIHRYNSIDTNIFCSFNTRNLYLDSLILPTEKTSYFSTQNNGNNAITQINDIQFFNYDFILTNYLNEQIINLSNTSEIPLVLVTQTTASDVNLELLNSIDNLYYLTIADSEHNVADQYKDRVLQIPICSSMEAPVIKDIDKIKDIAIINYNTTKINPSIIVKGKEFENRYNLELDTLKKFGGKLIFSSGESMLSSFDLMLAKFLHQSLPQVWLAQRYLFVELLPLWSPERCSRLETFEDVLPHVERSS